MGGFSELIKNFEKTRDYVRDFFVYGFKVRSDFSRKSSRTYDDEKRRAESWLGDNIRYDDSVRGRQISISVDSARIPENPLYQVYYSKSFTDNDIRLHFFLLDILSEGRVMPLKEIMSELDVRFGGLFEEQTVRNKLKEYVGEGLILSEKQGRTSYYGISRTDCDIVTVSENLSDAVKFFSEGGLFGVVGNGLLKTCGLKNDLFFIKHNYIVHTLEDYITSGLLKAMEEKRTVTFMSISPKRRNGDAVKNTVVPLSVLYSVQTGRRYLAAYVPLLKRFSTFRLDFMSDLKEESVYEGYDEIYAKFEANLGRCYGVSFGDRDRSVNGTPFKITFCIDEKTEDYVLGRLEREKRCAELKKEDEGLFSLTFDVFDPNEVMHWAKTFMGRIAKIEGGSDELRERFRKDIYRMQKMYGGGCDDDIQ